MAQSDTIRAYRTLLFEGDPGERETERERERERERQTERERERKRRCQFRQRRQTLTRTPHVRNRSAPGLGSGFLLPRPLAAPRLVPAPPAALPPPSPPAPAARRRPSSLRKARICSFAPPPPPPPRPCLLETFLHRELPSLFSGRREGGLRVCSNTNPSKTHAKVKEFDDSGAFQSAGDTFTNIRALAECPIESDMSIVSRWLRYGM